MEKLKTIIQYTGVSDCKWKRAACAATPTSPSAGGQRTPGTKTEIKNLNSFKALYRALSYEVERQTGVLNKGGRIVQETRTWDEREGVTPAPCARNTPMTTVTFPIPIWCP